MTFDPTTAPFRIHMGAEGLVISGSTKVLYEDGSCYLFHTFSGWDEPPAAEVNVQKKSNAPGATAGPSYQGERNLVIEGLVLVPGDDPDQIRAAVDRLFGALPTQDEPLIVHEYGLVRHLYARQGGQPTGDRIGRKIGRGRAAAFSIQLVALEPARLSGDGTAPTEHFETAPGQPGALEVGIGTGLVPPHTVTIGPSTNPRIGLAGGDLWYALTVPDGQELVIDFEKKSATLNGEYINTAMRGRWPNLARKSNTFTFTADAIGPAATFAVDTYLTYP